MRISDWSSDVCSSDLIEAEHGRALGARFTIYLPVYKGPMPQKQLESETPGPARDWSGGGRLLLVEDEDMVRAVAERALARAGYSRSEERRVGKACGSKCRCRWAP